MSQFLYLPCLSRQLEGEVVTDDMLGANTLLAYFHYCNKGVYPFSEGCKDQDLQSLASLDDSSIRFVHYTRRYASEHSKLARRNPPSEIPVVRR